MMIANYKKGDCIRGYDEKSDHYLVKLGKGGFMIIPAGDLIAKLDEDILFIAKSGGIIEPLKATLRYLVSSEDLGSLIHFAEEIRDKSEPYRVPGTKYSNMQVRSGVGDVSFDAGNHFYMSGI
jgi:hypothetical protein